MSKKSITLLSMLFCLTTAALAQTEITNQNDRVAALQVEAAAKAKAAQEAALAAQEAARAAQEAAEAVAKEAQRLSQQAEAKVPETKESTTVVEESTTEVKVTVKEEETTQPKQQWTTHVTIPTEASSAKEKSANAASEKVNEKLPYLMEGAVPVVNGKVQWTLNLDLPGHSAQQIYATLLPFLQKMTEEEQQLERSKVVMVNEGEHKIVATFQEWMVFSSTALALDRTKFNYLIQANCSDGHLEVILDHIYYNYSTKGDQNYKAEEWIVDKYAVNKKRTRFYPISGKFRRKTIDRKNEIFTNIRNAF